MNNNEKYYLFIEKNFWRNETWYFFFPVDWNQKAFLKLKKLFEQIQFTAEDNSKFEIRDRLYNKYDIDLLKATIPENNHRQAITILSGTLNIPKKIYNNNNNIDMEYINELFYGGSFEKLIG